MANQDDAFDPATVNKWIVSLCEDPTKEPEVADLHAYLKKHGKLDLVALKFEESFERRPKDAKIRYLLGRIHLRDGNKAAALKCFESAAQADPDYAFTYLAQAEIFEGQADEKGLVGALEGVIQSSREKSAVLGAVRRLAAFCAKRQEHQRAAGLWATVGERFADDPSVLREAVKGIDEAGKPALAADCLRSALASKTHPPGDRARFFIDLASLERRAGRTSDAAKSLDEAAKAAIDDPALARKVDESILTYHREDDRLTELSARYERDLANNRTSAVYAWRLARVRIAQSNLPQAREILLKGIEKNPGNILLLTGLADVAELQGKWPEVRDLAVLLLGREPQVREHRRREGMAWLEMGKPAEAEGCFLTYATSPAEMVEIARVYDKRQRWSDAAGWYRRALDLKADPEGSRALVSLLVRLDRLAEADQEAARCTSGNRERWAMLRDLLVQRGDLAKACVYARKEAEANPKEFAAVFGLGKLLVRVAPDEAEAVLRAALLLATKAERGRAYEELAGLAAGFKPGPLAILRGEILMLIKEDPADGGLYYALFRLQPGSFEILEEGRKNDPRHVRLRQELAPFYLRDKQYDLAIDVYRELIEIDPPRRDHYVYAIGEVYWALGHKDAAFGWWGKVQGSAKDKVGLTFQLAKKFESEGRFVQAIELLHQILKQEPEGALYHWTLAQLYRQVGSFDGLMTEYKWILAYSKDEGYLRTARQVISEKLADHAREYAEEGSWTRALEEFTEALRYAPNEPATGSLIGHIARCCEHLRDYAKAAEHYHQLLSRYPGIVVAASQGRTMNAALFATLQLRGNPECLKAYEDLVGPQAKDQLQQSIQKNDRTGVEKVLALYPLSRAAGEAVWWLAESSRKEGSALKAAGYLERLLAEFSLAGLDEMLVRARLVELCAHLKDWGTVSTQLGEMAARGKDKSVTIDGKSVPLRDYLQKWQKDLAAHGSLPGASWGLAGRDGRNSWSTVQELAPPLVQKWRYQAVAQPSINLTTLPPITAAGGLVYLSKEDHLVALDGSSGNVRWTAPLRVWRVKGRTNNTVQGVTFGIEGRLAVSQGVIAGIENDTEIRVYDAATGAPVWSRPTDVTRADGGPAGAARMRNRALIQAVVEHMEIVSATRQCFIVREGDKLRSYALRTGRMDWQTDVPASAQPLAVDTGMGNGNFPIRLDRHVLEWDGVLIHAYGDTIRAIDTQSGKDLWEVKVAGRPGVGGVSPFAAYFTVLPDGVVRACIAGDVLVTLSAAEGKLAAYELRTGRLRWELPGGAFVHESQLAADDQNLYALVNKSLTVIAHRSGLRLWNRDAKNYVPPMGQGMPPPTTAQARLSIAGSRIYLSSSEEQDGEVARLEALDRKSGKLLWEFPWETIGKAMGGMRVIGVDLWGRPIPVQTSAPVICDGWLYVVRSDGVLYALRGKSQEMAALRDAVRRDPESAQARFQLGDLLGSEGQPSLEIEEYKAALKLAQKKSDAPMRELVSELRSRLFVRLMKQGETTTDFESSLKLFVEARAYADGESSTARVLVRTAAVLLALLRDMEAVDVLSSILALCPSAPSPIEGAAESAGDYAKRQLAKLGPEAKARWEKAHAEEMEKAFAPGRSVEELEKAIERYAFSGKAERARIRIARMHFDQKRFTDAIGSLEKVKPEYLASADAETWFEAWDLLASALAQTGDDRRALGIYQKMLTEAAKDSGRLGSIKERAEKRHKELKESWERNGAFGSPLQKIWESPAPASKPPGPTFDAFRPAIDRGRIYVLDVRGTVQAIDASTLETVWQAKSEDFSGLFQTTNGLTSLPVDPLLAVKETILVVGGKTLRAFDPVTGAPLWSTPSPDGDGVIHQIVLDGNKVYTCETKGRVSARDERTGRLLWSVRPGASATGVMTDRSGMSGGGLFYSRIGVEGGRVVVQPAGDPGSLFAYDVATGKQAWRVIDANYAGYLKGRVLLEVGHGMAVFGDPAGLLACRDLADGKLRWKLNLGGPVEALLTAPDRILVATADQILSINAKTGRKDWAAAPDLNAPFSKEKDMRVGATSLAAKGKWLVVGTAGAVSILDLATGAVKDQVKTDAPPPTPRPGGKPFPFGKSFASVALGPEGIFWGVPSENGTRWTLLR